MVNRLIPASFPTLVPQKLTHWTPLVLLAGYTFQLSQWVTGRPGITHFLNAPPRRDADSLNFSIGLKDVSVERMGANT
jgi:hypothetical protein